MQNDVWYFQPTLMEGWINPILTSLNGRWWRLADAPFSGRAFMLTQYAMNAEYDLLSLKPAPDNSVNGSGTLIVLAGQTAHHCGSAELGECASDLWTATITRNLSLAANSLDYPPLTITWDQAPAGSMPFPSRCGASLIAEQRDITPGQSRVLGVAGGQLSFTAASDCRSAPIVTTNDVYYASAANLSLWRLGRQAPFSPRRSMQADDAIAMADAGVFPVSTSRLHFFDKSISLGGGLRYLERRWDESAGVSRMTKAELYADVWSCTLVTPEHDPSPLDCDWSHSRRMANTSVPPPYAPTGSLPVPIAQSADARGQGVRRVWHHRFGGVTSRAAVAAWTRSVPQGAADAFRRVDWSAAVSNVTMLQQPVLVPDEPDTPDSVTGGALPTTVAETRYDLPTTWAVDAEELNDPTSSFVRGSDAVLTHSIPMHFSTLQPLISTFHQQPSQMALTPDASTPWTYCATSSENSTRPAFDFTNRRRQHSMTLSNAVVYLGGGISDGVYTNDWVTHEASLCLMPDDPSYASTLGSGHIALPRHQWIVGFFIAHVQDAPEHEDGGYLGHEQYYSDPRFGPTIRVPWECDEGFHFMPPQDRSTTTLTCTSAGQWMDTALGSFRRCVPNVLQCRWPFVDAGFGECGDPQPIVTAVRLFGIGRGIPGRFVTQPTNADDATIVDVPSMGNLPLLNKQLYIHGAWLSLPVEVRVGGDICHFPQLRNSTLHCLDEADPTTCHRYATLITCTADFLNQPPSTDNFAMFMTIGRRQLVVTTVQVERNDYSVAVPLSMRLAEPQIHWMWSEACKWPEDGLNSTRRLVNCPTDRPFNVSICSLNLDNDYAAGDLERPLVFISSVREKLACDSGSWLEVGLPGSERLCDPRLPNFSCVRQSTCANCTFPPLLGSHVVRVVKPSQENNDALYSDSISNETAVISFASCASGRFINITTGAADSCQACPAGTSTNDQTDQQSCTPCAPGSYSSDPGWPSCRQCAASTFASASSSERCQPCTGGSWQLLVGRAECRYCEVGQYPRWTRPTLDPTCEACPSGSRCNDNVNGTIGALPGAFVQIQNSSGVISTAVCSYTACVGAEALSVCEDAEHCVNIERCPDGSVASELMTSTSGLAVLNCCGNYRRPALSGDGAEVNVLCASCIDGYSEVRGRCIACDGVRWDWLLCVALLALTCVYALHRFAPGGVTASGGLSIAAYFVQMSSLFMVGESLPAVFGFFNIDVVGITGTSSCILPLGDYGKIGLKMLSPLLAVLLLLLLLAAQLALRRAVLRSLWWQQQQSAPLHDNGNGQESASSAKPPAWIRLYCLAFPSGEERSPASASDKAAFFTDRPAHTKVRALSHLSAPLHERLLHDAGKGDKEEPEAAPERAPPAGNIIGVEFSADEAHFAQSLSSVLRPYRRTLLRLVMLSYNTLTVVCLAFFQTEDVGQFGQRLLTYPTASPDDNAYARLRPAVVFCLLLVCAWPVALAASLWRLRLWEAPDEPLLQQPQLQCRLVVTAMFAPRYWFFPSVVLCRRLVIIVALLFSSAESGFFVVLALNVVFYSAQLQLQPYASHWDNRAEGLTLFALCGQTILLSAHPLAATRPSAVSAGLWLLLVFPCVGFVVQAAFTSRSNLFACVQRLLHAARAPRGTYEVEL